MAENSFSWRSGEPDQNLQSDNRMLPLPLLAAPPSFAALPTCHLIIIILLFLKKPFKRFTLDSSNLFLDFNAVKSDILIFIDIPDQSLGKAAPSLTAAPPCGEQCFVQCAIPRCLLSVLRPPSHPKPHEKLESADPSFFPACDLCEWTGSREVLTSRHGVALLSNSPGT